MVALAEVWKDRKVAAASLNKRSLLIPDRERQLGVMPRLIRSAERRPKRALDGDVATEFCWPPFSRFSQTHPALLSISRR